MTFVGIEHHDGETVSFIVPHDRELLTTSARFYAFCRSLVDVGLDGQSKQ